MQQNRLYEGHKFCSAHNYYLLLACGSCLQNFFMNSMQNVLTDLRNQKGNKCHHIWCRPRVIIWIPVKKSEGRDDMSDVRSCPSSQKGKMRMDERGKVAYESDLRKWPYIIWARPLNCSLLKLSKIWSKLYYFIKLKARSYVAGGSIWMDASFFLLEIGANRGLAVKPQRTVLSMM